MWIPTASTEQMELAWAKCRANLAEFWPKASIGELDDAIGACFEIRTQAGRQYIEALSGGTQDERATAHRHVDEAQAMLDGACDAMLARV